MHRLAQFSLAHRALAALITVAVAIGGAVALGALKQELIPSITLPAAAVVTTYPGASPTVVENQVTGPLEAAARAVRGVEKVTSTSSTSLSVVSVTFRYGTDMSSAGQQLQTAVTRISRALPSAVDPQVITGSVDDLPVLQLAASGGADDAALAAAITTSLVPRLEKVDGVRQVSVTGIADQEITVTVNTPALLAAGISPTALTGVLRDNGVTLPAGTVTQGEQTWSVQAGTALTSVADLEGLPLRSSTGQVVHLRDVATVTDGAAAATSFSRLDGAPALAIAVTKTPDANTVDVSAAVAAALAEAQPALTGAQVRVAVVFDQAPFITSSITDLATEGALGLAMAVVVILLFLTSVRSTLVSAVSIPLSLLVAFITLDVVGYSLNLLTLAALTIAIGRVVDDAIVVIENIRRHLSYGEHKRAAIETAVREVAGAITASTLATVAVFLPIGLVSGITGELFRPFAMTVAIAMVASLLVALTIVPVLAYWFLPASLTGSVDPAAVRETAEAKERRGLWQRAYLPTLGAALRHPVVSLLVAVGVLAGTLALVPQLQTNLLGNSGQDTLTVTQTFEPGTSLTAQDEAAKGVEKALMATAGVVTVQTSVGSDPTRAAFAGAGTSPQATFAVTLDPSADSVRVQDAVTAATRPLRTGRVTDLQVSGGQSAFGSSTVDLEVTADDLGVLRTAAAQVQAAAQQVPGSSQVTNNLATDTQIVEVTVNRDAAAAAGLTESAVAGTVSALMSPAQIGSVDLGNGPVTVRLALGDAPTTVAGLAAIPVVGADGPHLLGQLATITQVSSPAAITRLDGRRSATVSVTPAGQDVGALSTRLTTAVDGLSLPAGASVRVGGVAADQASAFSDLGLALVLAIAIVYIVMVATFNSLGQPLILLVSVPFAATGALLALLVTGTALGVPALIGMLMLIGIVVSNAIVLIDLINQYRARGRTLHDAVVEGARKRLRPIVMTAAATIFALAPMAFGVTGGGGFLSKPLALVVIGGLFSSTLLTLILVPVIYTLTQRRGERRRLAAADLDAGPVPEPPATTGRHAAVPPAG